MPRPYVSFAEVKARVSIPDVLEVLGIADKFTEKNGVLTGCCPLPKHVHGPSPNPEQFKINRKGKVWLWHCFGDCDCGGDVIELVKNIKGMSDSHVRFWFAENFSDCLTLRKKEGKQPASGREKSAEEKSDADTKDLTPLRFYLDLDGAHDGSWRESTCRPASGTIAPSLTARGVCTIARSVLRSRTLWTRRLAGRMKLKTLRVENYKCVEDSEEIDIHQVTCFVGKNEAGKSALLEALYKLNPVDESAANFIEEDYPRRKLTTQRERGMELVYRTYSGTKIVLTFPRKVSESEIRSALLEVAERGSDAKAA